MTKELDRLILKMQAKQNRCKSAKLDLGTSQEADCEVQ